MITTWNEIVSRYNSLNHTSRGSKNLSDWGEIFASAYILDRRQANVMWQEIIDLNIRKDLTYAKYFVAQIFNKIAEHLPLHDAVEFLYMNPSRVPLLYVNPYNGCSFFDYCILGHYIVKDDMTAVVEFLRIRNRNNIEDDEDIQNSPYICNRLFDVTRKLESYSDNSWYTQYKESSPALVKRVYEWCERTFPNSRMSQLARVHLLILTNIVESDPLQAVKLLNLLEDLNTSMYTDFLYMHRDVIPKNQIRACSH